MFKIGDHVNCICSKYNIPPTLSGIIIKGPLDFAGENFYTVTFLGHGNLLMPEDCLSESNHFNVERIFMGNKVIMNSSTKKANKGDKGIIASEPKKRFGKVFFDVLIEGQNDLLNESDTSFDMQNPE